MNQKQGAVFRTMVVVAVLAAGIVYLATRPPRYREYGDGRFRVDTETGRKQVFMEGKWLYIPEMKPVKLQETMEAKLTEQLEKQLAVPSIALPTLPEPKLDLPQASTPAKK